MVNILYDMQSVTIVNVFCITKKPTLGFVVVEDATVVDTEGTCEWGRAEGLAISTRRSLSCFKLST